MEKTLRLVGRTSGEIYILRYPSSLQGFCDFDFSYFAKDAIDFCNESLKLGTSDPERFADLRREIESSHCFIGHHIRTIYDKIVLDCWIDYLCRRDSVGTNTLWNRFIGCKTPFEKQVFSRLCDYRYNRAINEWLNIVRVQDYARSKTDFIFNKEIRSAEDAAVRRDYFDLMFSVTAKELGCRLEDLGVTKVFSVGRLPSSPFMFPNVSKEIVRHVLTDFDYNDDYSDIGDYSECSDQIAMDAFARMKAGLPADLGSYNVVHTKMENYPDKIYMPCSLKAAVDLEIDAIIEDGGWLARCKRCGRLYLRDKDHTEEYCRQMNRNGKTCLEIYEEEHPKPKLSEELLAKCRAVTDKVYERVGDSVSTHEYESWYSYLEAMKNKVISGEISPEELDDFLNYSLAVDISKSHPIQSVEKLRPSRERVVKPFVPERVYRSDIEKKPVQPEPAEIEPPVKEGGFFTSPTVQRQKERTRISHVIRGGDSGENRFRPFTPNPSESVPIDNRVRIDNTLQKSAEPPSEYHEEPKKPAGFEPMFTEKAETFIPDYPVTEEPKQPQTTVPQNIPDVKSTEKISKINENSGENSVKPTNYADIPVNTKPRVIKKNAAAISAYGKMAGAQFSTPQSGFSGAAEELSEIHETLEKSEREEPRDDFDNTNPYAEPIYSTEEPEREPFRDIGSIFDVLEQSENEMSAKPAKKPKTAEKEPVPEWEESEKKAEQTREIPKEITKENAPKGFWTEDRGLFPKDSQPEKDSQSEQSELDMLKEKKHGKSNKTRRLYDVIMREPDDNPNFRK